MTPLIFLDCETTGLDPARHEIWEVAAIVRDDERNTRTEYVWQLPVDLGQADTIALNIGQFMDRRWTEWKTYDSETGVETHQSFAMPHGVWDPQEMDVWCAEFARLTWGAHLVGAVVSFDADRLERLLRSWNQCPGWHYHLIDVEALAAGFALGRAKGIALSAPSDREANQIRSETGIDLHGIGSWRGALDAVPLAKTLPWRSEDLSRSVGVDPDKLARHTALGDAKWAEAIFDAVMGAPS